MRLDPRSIPYRALRTGVQWAVAVGTALALLTSVVEARLAPLAFALGVGLAGLAGAGWAVAYHRRFAYEVTADSLDITSGVISRRTREIPLGRIQNVDLRQGVVPRLLGLAEVRFETAGGRGTEASLRFVDRAVAERLQEQVDRYGEGASAAGAVPDEAGVERVATPGAHEPAEAATATANRARSRTADEPLYAITPVELGLLSVTSVDWRAVGFVVLAGVGFLPVPSAGGTDVSPLMPAAVAVQPVLLTVAGIAGNAALLTARFFGFRLWRTGETLRYERGLLRRFSGSIPLDRVHLLRLRDNPITRRLGLGALDIETAGYGPESDGDTAAAVPIADRRRVLDLARSVEPFPDVAFERPPRRARTRYAVRYAAVAALVVGVLFAVDWFVRPVPWYLGVALLALAPPAAHLTWLHRGYALADGTLLVRSGFWRRTTHVVPLYRVQTVGTTATLFQRRWSLATLRVDTASGAPAAHDLDAATAREVRDAVGDGLLADRARRLGDGRGTASTTAWA